MKHRIALYLLFVAALCMGCGSRLGMRELELLESRVGDVPDGVDWSKIQWEYPIEYGLYKKLHNKWY